MQTTIDMAGRVVIPKSLRDASGLTAGDVEVSVDGAGIRIEPVARAELVERDGRLVIPDAGARIDDDMVNSLRLADQK